VTDPPYGFIHRLDDAGSTRLRASTLGLLSEDLSLEFAIAIPLRSVLINFQHSLLSPRKIYRLEIPMYLPRVGAGL